MISQTLLSLSSVVATWAIIMANLYVFKKWVYAGFPVSWNRISLWVTVSLLLIALTFLFVQVFAYKWFTLITAVILPRAVCLVALHMFSVLFRSYMTMRYQQSVTPMKFCTVLALMYALFVIGTCLTISLNSPVFTYFTDMIVYFLLQGSVIGMAVISFLLSIVSKQVTMQQPYTHAPQHHTTFSDDTDRW